MESIFEGKSETVTMKSRILEIQEPNDFKDQEIEMQKRRDLLKKGCIKYSKEIDEFYKNHKGIRKQTLDEDILLILANQVRHFFGIRFENFRFVFKS